MRLHTSRRYDSFRLKKRISLNCRTGWRTQVRSFGCEVLDVIPSPALLANYKLTALGVDHRFSPINEIGY